MQNPKYKFAGVGIETSLQGDKKLVLHVTIGRSKKKSESNTSKQPIWMTIPGSLNIELVELPHGMNRNQVCQHLMEHEAYQAPSFQKFLREYLETHPEKDDTPREKKRERKKAGIDAIKSTEKEKSEESV